MERRVTSLTVKQTCELGKLLSEHLLGGDVVALSGDLGAGKTAFAQGVGKGLGIVDSITSPTFTLIHEYKGLVKGAKIRLIHMDLYRLRYPEEAEVIGIEEAFVEDAICLIEWPDIAEDYLPDDRLNVEIHGSGDMPRQITFQAKDPSWEQRLGFLNKF